MSDTKIGWYHIEESFDSTGIDVAIRDNRTGKMIVFKIEDFREYDRLVSFLANNRRIGTLDELSKKVSGE